MYTDGLIDFINSSPSAFHAIDKLSSMLDSAGYARLCESGRWEIEAGGKYYTTRNLSSLIAFRAPESGDMQARITASHCDSPVFKIKENAEVTVRDKYVQLNVERYGGMLMSTWLDRPLSVAGRALVKTPDGLSTRLVNLADDTLVIPNVAIHMNRSANENLTYNAQQDLQPLFGSDKAKGQFKKTVADACGCLEGDLLGSDLFLYSRVPPAVWGRDGEFVSAGRLDDLECVYATATAFIKSESPAGMPVLAVFDNEEVGSTTKQGADSTFLTDVLTRAWRALGADDSDICAYKASSVMLSCDNAHAVHPNHPEYSDATNGVYMNCGIVIKESANQKYTSDAASKAILRRVLDKACVKYQFFANRSDMIGGGTLGNISNSHFSLNTVDIGLAQLAMHSSWETAGVFDLTHMINGCAAFYNSSIRVVSDGEFIIDTGAV